MTFLGSFVEGLAVLPRGGVGGVNFGAALAGGLDFAEAFAEAFLGRPTGAAEVRVVVVVLPHSACIIFCHFFVLIQK